MRYSKLSKQKINKLIKHFAIDIDATKTAMLLGLNRKTVNRYYLIFRQAIYQHQVHQAEQLFGLVECDETYFGPRRKRGKAGNMKRGRGTKKQPVFGIMARDGKVYTELIPNCRKIVLQRIIKRRLEKKSTVFTDGWRGYNGLWRAGYTHFVINHKEFFSAHQYVHINGIESFWSFAKRRLAKFNGVKTHFQLHLKECEWRWRKPPDQLEKELKEILKKQEKNRGSPPAQGERVLPKSSLAKKIRGRIPGSNQK